MTTPHGTHELSESDREFYEQRFEQRYVRVTTVPPGLGSRRDRRYGARMAKLTTTGRAKR